MYIFPVLTTLLRKLEGPKKLFFWPKIKGGEIFPKPLYNIKTKRKNVIYRRWPEIKGAELGEGGRKLEGPTHGHFLVRN